MTSLWCAIWYSCDGGLPRRSVSMIATTAERAAWRRHLEETAGRTPSPRRAAARSRPARAGKTADPPRRTPAASLQRRQRALRTVAGAAGAAVAAHPARLPALQSQRRDRGQARPTVGGGACWPGLVGALSACALCSVAGEERRKERQAREPFRPLFEDDTSATIRTMRATAFGAGAACHERRAALRLLNADLTCRVCLNITQVGTIADARAHPPPAAIDLIRLGCVLVRRAAVRRTP